MSDISTIDCRCDACQTDLRLPASAAGKVGQCPSCGATFAVPSGQSPNVSSAYHPPMSGMAANSPVPGGTTYDPSYRPSLSLIMVPLYISAALYALIGIGCLIVPAMFMVGDGEAAIVLIPFLLVSVVCLALAGFIFFFTSQLPQRKKWAWITAIVFGAMFTPSAFFMLGIPILVGVFRKDVMDWYNTA